MSTWKLTTAGIALLLAAWGCRADDAAADADKQVYGILDDRMALLFGPDADPVRLEQNQDRLRNVMLAELAAVQARERSELLEEIFPPQEDEPAGDGSPGGESADGGTGALPESDPGTLGGPNPRGQIQDQDLPPGELDLNQEEDELPTLDERLAAIAERYKDDLTVKRATRASPLGERVLTLAECQEIAAANSWDYQTQKERVYQQVLDLTLARYRFEMQYGVTTSYDWLSRDNPAGLDQTRTGSLTTRFSLSKALASGGVAVFDFTTNFIKRFTGIGSTDSEISSAMTFSFTQPLLSGFGKEIAQEPLVQAERNVIYSIRDFERFRRDFALRICRSYYSLLRQQDSIENNRRNYLGVIDSREFEQAQKERGRTDQINLDRALNNEYESRNSWISAMQSYENALDAFKIELGLPMVANISPDFAELELLRSIGVSGIEMDQYAAERVALSQRLDFQNDIEQLADSERDVNVAADNLRTVLDVNASYAVGTDRDTMFDFEGDGAAWAAGFDLDLPLDLLAERNAYRRSLISLDAQRRNTTLAEDRVKLEVRDSLRSLRELQESYEIQVRRVAVAERRVTAANLQFRKGRVAIREILEATNNLAAARNSLTTALTGYQVGVMQLYLDLGLLRVEDTGIRFEEFVDPGVADE